MGETAGSGCHSDKAPPDSPVFLEVMKLVVRALGQEVLPTIPISAGISSKLFSPALRC
jgi:hypothetical protein